MKVNIFTSLTIKTWLLLGFLVALAINVSACAGAQRANGSVQPPEYLPLDTPEAPIFNAFWAMKQSDAVKAREQYTHVMRAAIERDDGNAFVRQRALLKDDELIFAGRRSYFNDDADRVFVIIRLADSSWLTEDCEEEVLVTHTEDGWKISSMDLLGCDHFRK